MGKVIANASMSLDGFVAFEDDDIGELFEWYDNGDVEIVNAGDLPPFHVTRASADNCRAGGAGAAPHRRPRPRLPARAAARLVVPGLRGLHVRHGGHRCGGRAREADRG